MFNSRLLLPLLAALLGLAFATGAQAQATRTWVSGVGDDVNPCSRTAPCKTFAGAISKTAAGGEISVLDPGGFGAVTINKSITINGTGTLGGILASLTNGVVINAGANDIIILRNISINGAANGTNGVRFLAGKELHLEDVEIHGFTQNGVDFQPSGQASLFLKNTTINRIDSAALTQAAVLIKPGAAGSAFAVIEDSTIEGNRIGIRAEDRTKLTVRNSSVSRNSQFGGLVVSASAATAMFVSGSNFSYNGPVTLVAAGTAFRVEGAQAVLRLGSSLVTGSEIGLLPVSGGAILSYGDNQVSGNGSDGAPTGFITEI